MKRRGSYFKIALTVFLTAASIIVFNNFISTNNDVFGAVGRIISFIMTILAPFTVAFIIAYLFNPLVSLLERIFSRWKKPRVRRATAIAIIYMAMLAIFVVFFAVFMPSIVKNIGDLVANIPEYYKDAQRWVVESFGQTNISETQLYESFVNNSYDKNLAQLINWSTTLKSTLETLAGLISVLGTIFFSVLISIYMLFDKDNLISFAKRLTLTVFKKKGSGILEFASFCNGVFASYVRSRLLVSLILGLVSLIGFYIIGIPYAPLFCVIIIVTNLIPYVGPLVGAVPPVLIALLTRPILAVYVIVLLVLIQLLDTAVVSPHIMKTEMKINAFWVMVGIIVGGGLLGFLGMFIGVPLVAIAKAELERYMKHRGQGGAEHKPVQAAQQASSEENET